MDVLLKVRLVNSLLRAREGVEYASGVATIMTNKVAATEKNLDILSLPICIIKRKLYNYTCGKTLFKIFMILMCILFITTALVATVSQH